jgi:hypothetical protein
MIESRRAYAALMKAASRALRELRLNAISTR